MYFRDMIGGFIPGGLPNNMGRKVVTAGRAALGVARFGAAVVATAAIVTVREGPAAVVKTLFDAVQEGGRD